MKHLARLLRRAANHLDPPPVGSRMHIRVTCDTSEARNALDALSVSIQRTALAVQRSCEAVTRARMTTEGSV